MGWSACPRDPNVTDLPRGVSTKSGAATASRWRSSRSAGVVDREAASPAWPTAETSPPGSSTRSGPGSAGWTCTSKRLTYRQETCGGRSGACGGSWERLPGCWSRGGGSERAAGNHESSSSHPASRGLRAAREFSFSGLVEAADKGCYTGCRAGPRRGRHQTETVGAS